jgi:hypothetical protein
MGIDVFLSPVYKSSQSHPAPPRPAPPPDPLEWCKKAYLLDWNGALIGYLRTNSKDFVGIWKCVNAIAAESLPRDRAELRRRKQEILQALKRLRHQRAIVRWRRKYIFCVTV